MRRLRLLLLTPLLAGVLAVLCANSAWAANPVIADCSANNALTGHYSIQQLQDALNTLPVDVREYTSCPDVIQRQLDKQLSILHGNGGGGGGGGSFLPLWLIIVLAVLILGGGGYAGWLAYSRRGAEQPEAPEDPPTAPL